MSIQTETAVIPVFTIGDRLRKAREVTGLDMAEFANEIGVSRQTVGNAELGKVTPRKIMLKAWSMRTGVPIEWLETGTTNPHQDGPDGGLDVVRHQGLEPRTR